MEKLITHKEAAQILRINPLTLYELRRSGKIPYIRMGAKRIRYKVSDIEAFIEQWRVSPKNEV